MRTTTRRNRQIAAVLAGMRPSVFDIDSPKPLAKGIHKQISESLPKLQRKQIRIFLAWWCNRFAYLEACQANNAYRYHISGRRGKKITQPEKAYAENRAAFRMDRMKRKRMARKEFKRARTMY